MSQAVQEASRVKSEQASGSNPGMRRVGSKTWLPLDEVGTGSCSPGDESVRVKIKEKLWISEAVDAYFLRKNEEMLEKMLPKVS